MSGCEKVKRRTNSTGPYDDIWDPVLRIIDAFGIDRCMWGTDWTRTSGMLTYEPASDQVSLVVSAAVIASPMQCQAASNCPNSAWARAKCGKKNALPADDARQDRKARAPDPSAPGRRRCPPLPIRTVP